MSNPIDTNNVDALVSKYIQLRDKRDEVRKQHKEVEARYKTGLDYLGAQLLAVIDAFGAEHIACASGTAIKTFKTSATVQDWPATLAYIRENEFWDLLEARVSKIAVESLIVETQQPIPGVKLSQMVDVSVRRPT
jgi:hypothetical protein